MRLPLPTSYPPMEALLVAEIPTGRNWQYEPKWDGFRCLAFRDGCGLASPRSPWPNFTVGHDEITMLESSNVNSRSSCRRISIRHRLVYQVLEKERVVKVLRLWTRYE